MEIAMRKIRAVVTVDIECDPEAMQVIGIKWETSGLDQSPGSLDAMMMYTALEMILRQSRDKQMQPASSKSKYDVH